LSVESRTDKVDFQFTNLKLRLRVITRSRRIVVIFSLAFISQGQLLPTGGFQEFCTGLGFVGLVVAAISLLMKTESEDSVAVEERSYSKLSWRITLFGLAIFGVLCIQRWFVSGTTDAGGDIAPPIGFAWIAKLFHPFVWSGSNLGGAASNQTQLPWAGVLWTVHELGGSGALAQRIWLSALVGAIFLATGAFARSLQLSPISGVVLATLFFFNPVTLSFVGDNSVYLVAMMLVPTLASILISYGAFRARLWQVCVVFVLSAPFLGFAYSNPPIVLMIVLTTASTALLVWAQYGQISALRALRGALIGGSLLVGASAYWIIPALSTLSTVATANLSTLSGWVIFETRSTLANGLWLNTSWGWMNPIYYPYSSDFSHFPLVLVLVFVPLSAFVLLSVRHVASSSERLPRLIGVIALMTLGVIFFSTGTRFPGNIIFDPLYNLKFGWLLREPGRFLIAASLGFAILAAFFVEHFLSIEPLRHPNEDSKGHLTRKFKPSLFIATILIAGGLAAAFPLWTGQVIPNARNVFPSSHVHVPQYWSTTAQYLNSSRAPSGALMVLPADDFYQMPYTWYYGSDGFVANLMARNVVVPSAQGYGLVSSELLNAVKLESSSLLNENWVLAGRVLAAVGTPVVLVRGDINSKFPNRQITSPMRLARALAKDPEMIFVHRYGPLSLFELKPQFRETYTDFATVDSSSPHLSELGIVSGRTALVSSKPIVGHISLTELPPLSKWKVGKSAITTEILLASQQHYSVQSLEPKKSPNLKLTISKSGPLVAKLSIGTGESLIENGDFSKGLWGPLNNCYGSKIVASKYVSDNLSIVSTKMHPDLALQISATDNNACEMKSIALPKGEILLSLETRTLLGGPPKFCLLEVPFNVCAPSATLKARKTWHQVTTVVQPLNGTTSLKLFLSANADVGGATSVEQYANVQIRRINGDPNSVIVGTPAKLVYGGLVNFRTGFSTSWTSASKDQHVIVNGLTNGWLTSSSSTERIDPTNSVTSGEWEDEGALVLASILVAYGVRIVSRKGQFSANMRKRFRK
jgi:hypothetical protein